MHPSLILKTGLLAVGALLAALPGHAQAADPPRCVYTAVANLPLKYMGPALGVTMEGSINGKPAPLLVNTATPRHFLTRTGAERHGLRLRNSDSTLLGISGYSRVYSARIDEFSVGPASTRRLDLPVIGDQSAPPPWDGMVGASYLLQADLELSYAEKRIRMFRPTNCDDQFLAYWDRKTVEIPFEESASPGVNPRFGVVLNGVALTAVIDSSATSSMVSLEAARRIGLKLDAPNVERIGDAAGIGQARSARWSAVFDSLRIGTETISSPRLDVVDAGRLQVDVLLGADFLRSHRVLFAMSQSRLYFSYVGGDALSQRRAIEPWVEQEAGEGNVDAQMALAGAYLRQRGEAGQKQGQVWLERAASNGNPQANALIGQRLVQLGRPAEASYRLRKAVDAQPNARRAALWLYAARMLNKQGELGRKELEKNFEREDDWPEPVARFYLGKLSEAELIKEARLDDKSARDNLCLARIHIALRHGWEGDTARAASARAQQRQDCGAGGAP